MVEGKISLSKEAFAELAKDYRANPVLFARDICGCELIEWQARFLNALLADKFICRPSGHSTGKTFATCVAMLWMLMFFPQCHIRATSATFDQLKSVMWDQLKRVISCSALSLWVSINESRAVSNLFPQNWILALAWNKDSPQAWAGEHCASPVGVFDECSDIPEIIFESWSGSSEHEGSRTILLGQPRLTHGKLFRAARDPRYNVEHLSSENNPFAPPGLAESARRDYGENSDYYRIRIQGLFPQSDSTAMFPGAHLKAVEDIPLPAFLPVAGLDVAGPGRDRSVLAVRAGNVVAGLYKYDTGDHVLLRRLVLDALGCHGCSVLAADTNGYGYGLGEFLKREPGFLLIPVLGQERAANSRKYHNRRSEAYGRLSDLWKDLRFAGSGVSPEALGAAARQLGAVRNYYDKHMRISVLEKDEIKKELKGESPDFADALAYCAIPHPAAIARMRTQERQLDDVELPGTRSRYG